MSVRERIEWIGRMALLLFVLASAAFLSAITAMRLAVQGREVVMPDVTGKKLADAQTALRAHGLGIKVEDRIYSMQPVGAVVRQSPPAGMRVKVGQWAHVVLSLGPQETTIPDLTLKSMRADRIQLLRGGLQLGEVSSIFLEDQPVDTVVMQDPTAGSKNAESARVDLLVSLGPRPAEYVMPDLQALPLGDAEARIVAAGLKLEKLDFAPYSSLAHGIVAAQTPTPGSRVDEGSNVELQVAE